jgi:hypothetical protein
MGRGKSTKQQSIQSFFQIESDPRKIPEWYKSETETETQLLKQRSFFLGTNSDNDDDSGAAGPLSYPSMNVNKIGAKNVIVTK